MKFRRPYAAFTLIEMLAVIAIIGIIAAVVAPTFGNFRKGDAMLACTRQMLGAVSRARQLAISQHTTVYLVFLPTNYWGAFDANWWIDPQLLSQRIAATNLADKQLTGYTYICLRGVGDQPGQGVAHYLSPWQTLPEATFIALWKFDAGPATYTDLTNYFDTTGTRTESYRVRGFNTVALPLPTETSTYFANLPCVAFNYLGQLVAADGTMMDHDEFIPLAHGSVSPAIDPGTKTYLLDYPAVLEKPPGNSIDSFNLIRIDRFTGRARLEHQEIR